MKPVRKPFSLPPSRPVDMSVGGYRPCFEIGSGGMASVYIARETASTGLRRTVALKLMHEHLRSNERFKKRFLDEARVLTQISHPYVCRVLGFGEEDGRPFIAMEYLIGEPLSRVLRALKRGGASVSVAERARLFGRVLADIAEGIHAAHETCDARGRPLAVVHRDLSPQNLFLLYDGTVRILDFGIARYRDRYVKTAAQGRLIGKLPYMAPEQLQGATYDRRVDIWALGIVLWELVTQDRLFRRDTELRTMEAVCSDPIPKASEVVAGLPAGLDPILERALERDPEQRYQTARELCEDLERWLARTGDPVTHAALSDFLNGFFPGSQTERRRWAEHATPESGPHPSPELETGFDGSDFSDDSTPSLTFPKQIPRGDELVTTEHTPTVSYRPRFARFSFSPEAPTALGAPTRTIPSLTPPALPPAPPSARSSYAPAALPPFTTVSLPPLPSAPLPNLNRNGSKWPFRLPRRWRLSQRELLTRSSAPDTLAAALALSMRADSIGSPARTRLRYMGSVAASVAVLTFAVVFGSQRFGGAENASLAHDARDATRVAPAAAPALETPAPAAAQAAPEPATPPPDTPESLSTELDPVQSEFENVTPEQLTVAAARTADTLEVSRPVVPSERERTVVTAKVEQQTTARQTQTQTSPVATGQVLIMSAKPGTSVYFKGRLLGRTPLRVRLPAGTTQLSIQANANGPRSVVSTKVSPGRVNVVALK